VRRAAWGHSCTHVAHCAARDVKTGLISKVTGGIRRVDVTALHPVDRRNPLRPAKLLNLKDRDLAERVGFGPDHLL
jgi:hypothetical protein